MSVTKAGLAGTDQRDGRSGTMGQGLSESRGSGLVHAGSLVRGNVNVLSWRDILIYLVFHRSKDLYLRTVSPYHR